MHRAAPLAKYRRGSCNSDGRAMVHSVVTCKYDLNSQQAVDVSVD